MNRISLAALLGLAVVLAGCGGGDGSSSSGGGNAQVNVFVTDSFREDYSHVWATIFRVDFIDFNNNVVNVFNDANGVIIDLKTLRDVNGQRFAFLSQATIPAGTYSKVMVTLAPTINLIANGTTIATPLQLDASLPKDNSGNVQITFNLPSPRNISGSDDVVVDFDLGNFRLQLGKIIPALKEGGENGLNNKGRHEESDYEGTISGLSGSGGVFSFTLTRGNRSVAVTTDASTVIFNANALPNPTLANGKRVHVRGTFDKATNSIAAASIKIQSDQGADQPEVKGIPSTLNPGAGTFNVTVTRARGLVPVKTVVKVVTTPNTIFRGDSGVLLTVDEFFAALATATRVEVEGTFDSTTNTLTATRAKLEDENEHAGDQVEVKGAPGALNTVAGTFAVNPVTEFEGFSYSGSGGINVTTNGTTTFRLANGTTVSKVDFFTALATAGSVKVEGSLSGTTLTAKSARIL